MNRSEGRKALYTGHWRRYLRHRKGDNGNKDRVPPGKGEREVEEIGCSHSGIPLLDFVNNCLAKVSVEESTTALNSHSFNFNESKGHEFPSILNETQGQESVTVEIKANNKKHCRVKTGENQFFLLHKFSHGQCD